MMADARQQVFLIGDELAMIRHRPREAAQNLGNTGTVGSESLRSA